MRHLKFKSVFDIMGPVMIGPSSSHTAGAVRIGKIVHSIFGDQPTEVEFHLYQSFAKTYRGHGTDLALVAGKPELLLLIHFITRVLHPLQLVICMTITMPTDLLHFLDYQPRFVQ